MRHKTKFIISRLSAPRPKIKPQYNHRDFKGKNRKPPASPAPPSGQGLGGRAGGFLPAPPPQEPRLAATSAPRPAPARAPRGLPSPPAAPLRPGLPAGSPVPSQAPQLPPGLYFFNSGRSRSLRGPSGRGAVPLTRCPGPGPPSQPSSPRPPTAFPQPGVPLATSAPSSPSLSPQPRPPGPSPLRPAAPGARPAARLPSAGCPPRPRPSPDPRAPAAHPRTPRC